MDGFAQKVGLVRGLRCKLLRRSNMFIARTSNRQRAPAERNVLYVFDLHSAPSERGQIREIAAYKHFAPPEQESLTQLSDFLCKARRDRGRGSVFVSGGPRNSRKRSVHGESAASSCWAERWSSSTFIYYFFGFSSQSTLTITHLPLDFAMCK
jgi:hypothetical protein